MGDPDRRPMPSVLLVILAMFGLASFQKFSGSVPGSDRAATAKGEEKAAPDNARSGRRGGGSSDKPEARILGPLLDHFRFGADGEELLRAALDDPKDGQKHSLRFLIATVPDPVRSTNSHRFDEWIDSIQRGVRIRRLPAGWIPDAVGIAGRLPRRTRIAPARSRSPGPSPRRRSRRGQSLRIANRACSSSGAGSRRRVTPRCWPSCWSPSRRRSDSTR